jgi:hypothetical protein
VRYFDGRTYEWVGLSRQPNIISKVCLSNVQANDLCCKALSDAGKFPLLPLVPVVVHVSLSGNIFALRLYMTFVLL